MHTPLIPALLWPEMGIRVFSPAQGLDPYAGFYLVLMSYGSPEHFAYVYSEASILRHLFTLQVVVKFPFTRVQRLKRKKFKRKLSMTLSQCDLGTIKLFNIMIYFNKTLFK